MHNLKEKTKKAFIWDYSGNFLSYFLNFLITLFLARLLSPEDYGSFAILTALGSVTSLLMDTGLNSALIQNKDANDEHFKTVFVFNLLTGLLFFVLLFSFSYLIASFYNKPILYDLIRVYSLIFIISSFGIVRRTKLRKELNFKLITQINTSSNLISGAIAIVSAYFNFGIWSLLLHSMLNVLLSNIFLYYKVKTKGKFTFKLNIIHLKLLWSFGFPIFISSVIYRISTSLESLLMGKFFSIETLGYFNRSQSFNNFITVNTTTSITNVFFPAISILQDDNEKILNAVFKVIHIMCFLIFFLLGFIYLVTDDLIIILLTEKWIATVDIIRILLISGFIFPLSALLLNILKGKGRSKLFLKISMIQQLIFLCNFTTAYFFGFYYYLIGYTVIALIGILINIYFVAKVLNVKSSWFLKIIVKYLSITLILVTSLYYVLNFYFENNYMHFGITLAIFTILYFMLNLILRNEGLKFLFSEIKGIMPS